MASILPFKSNGSARHAPGAVPGGTLVAMRHIDLETVVETVRVLRVFGRISLLDEFNGRCHAAGTITADPAPVPKTAPAQTTQT